MSMMAELQGSSLEELAICKDGEGQDDSARLEGAGRGESCGVSLPALSWKMTGVE